MSGCKVPMASCDMPTEPLPRVEPDVMRGRVVFTNGTEMGLGYYRYGREVERFEMDGVMYLPAGRAGCGMCALEPLEMGGRSWMEGREADLGHGARAHLSAGGDGTFLHVERDMVIGAGDGFERRTASVDVPVSACPWCGRPLGGGR